MAIIESLDLEIEFYNPFFSEHTFKKAMGQAGDVTKIIC